MNEEKIEVNVLDELNKGACMGRDAIHYVLDKVKDDSLKEELDKQYIVDSILKLNDKKYVKDLLDTKWLYFLTNTNERKRLEDFIKEVWY